MEYGGNYNSYSTTSYGAQGGAGGGGFVAGSGSQDASASRERKDTIRPVTIKQLIEAQEPNQQDTEFKIDGNEVTQITFVGQVRNISQQATNFTYKLDDGTGTIEVKHWRETDSSNDAGSGSGGKAKIEQDAYVRVWGKIKQFNTKRHIGTVVPIRPVQDMNEVQYHLLEATAVHLFFTKGPVSAAGKQDTGMTDAHTNGQTNGVNGGRQLPAGLSAGARKMYACLSSSVTNEGLHMQELAVKMGLDAAGVARAADELSNHGLVYTTVDDQTWAILEEM